MFSKVVTVGVLAALVAALIGGSAYILFRSNDRVIAQGEGGYNQRSVASASRSGSDNDGTQAGNGYQGGQAESRGEGNAEAGQVGNGYQGGQQAESRGEGNAGAGQAGSAQEERLFENAGGGHPVDTWMTMEGRVGSLVDDELTIETAEGEFIVHTGPEWYWESEGVAIDIGDQVEASGFYDEDTFELAKLENITTGQTVLLRDETGRPLWAGRGGQGRGNGRSG